MPKIRKTLEQRFWPKVDRSGDCWIWTGIKHIARGYGMTWDDKGYKERKRILAHVASWIIHHGPVPEGLFVLHGCDNRLCVNPAHLHLGTIADNQREMKERGRACHGSRSPMAKLNEKQVGEARKRVADGETITAIAESFGVSVSAMSLAVRGDHWARVGAPPVRRPNMAGMNNPMAKLSDGERMAILAGRMAGESYKELASRFGISYGHIWAICQKAIPVPRPASSATPQTHSIPA